MRARDALRGFVPQWAQMLVDRRKKGEMKRFAVLEWFVGSTVMHLLTNVDPGYQDQSDWYAATYPKIHDHGDDQVPRWEAWAEPMVESS